MAKRSQESTPSSGLWLPLLLASLLPGACMVAHAETITITNTSPLPSGEVGDFYSQTLAATGGSGNYQWTVSSGALPVGLALSPGGNVCDSGPASACAIAGTPTAAGTSIFFITVVDTQTQSSTTQQFSLTIVPLLVITTASLPNATMGALYSETLTVSGGLPPYVWFVDQGSALPAGLLLNGNTGQISGTPTTAGGSKVLISVVDTLQTTATRGFGLTVNLPPSITTNSPLPSGTVGINYSQILAASNGTPPYVWTVTTGTLPAGLSLNSATGQISGTPTAAGTSNPTIQVADLWGAAASKPFALTVIGVLSITSSSPLPGGTVGAGYSQTLTATGGSGQYTWSVSAGALPAGLSLSAATGQISGTPTTSGTSNFSIQVIDSAQDSATKPFALTINPALSITTNSPLPGGTVGVSYSQTLAASGGAPPYTWTVTTGALPAGLSLNSAGGQISGTPTTSGISNFSIQVTDTNHVTAAKTFSLTVNLTLTITTNSALPGGTVGFAYSQTLAASGGTPPYNWTLSAGALPVGLSLNPASGQISGTPPTAGTSNFSIQVSDSRGLIANKSFTLSINTPLVITTSSPLPGATVSAKYSQTLTASGGLPPYSWALVQGSLPAGLSLNPASGGISGTPTVSGGANFIVLVTDANRVTATAPLTLTVNPALSISSALPSPTAGVSYSQTVALNGGTAPYTYVVSAGALPAGLSLNSATGQIGGTPTTSGVSTFTIQVTDSNGATASQQYHLTVNAHLIITSTSPLAGGTANVSYTFTFQAADGAPPYTWAVGGGALPAGILLNPATGQISGKPTAGGAATFTMQVTDANGVTASAQFTLTIAPNPAITTATLPSVALGSPYSTQLSATGTGSPFTWSIAAGSLPPGLALSSGGLLSGTPSAPGTFTFTVLVTDVNNNSASTTYSLTVPQVPLTVTIQPQSGTALPQQQLPITLTLPQAYPVDLAGELVLQFTPTQAAPVADPAIQFSTGGGTVAFQIPAGQTTAVFPQPQLAVQTGTVAGAIVLTATATAGGVPVTLSSSPEVTVNLPPEPPGILSVSIQQLSAGFNVVVTGYSNTREIAQASFTFTAQPGSQLQSASFTPTGVSAAFESWYASGASDTFGSQFLYTQPFTITTGNVGALQSVSVTLTNSQGASSAVTVDF